MERPREQRYRHIANQHSLSTHQVSHRISSQDQQITYRLLHRSTSQISSAVAINVPEFSTASGGNSPSVTHPTTPAIQEHVHLLIIWARKAVMDRYRPSVPMANSVDLGGIAQLMASRIMRRHFTILGITRALVEVVWIYLKAIKKTGFRQIMKVEHVQARTYPRCKEMLYCLRIIVSIRP